MGRERRLDSPYPISPARRSDAITVLHYRSLRTLAQTQWRRFYYFFQLRTLMNKVQSIITLAALLGVSTVVAADPSEFARGNMMRFDVAEMDANHDGKISKDEFMAYGETMWGRMSGGKDSVSVADAGKDFASGNMNFNAKAMDTDHDGTISKDEFLKYGEAKWNKMDTGGKGMMSVADASKDFSRGNMHPK
jgi:Ca2+-binding EF-hand superfamily protein